MIRDPIDRFESFYYFSRFGNVKGGGGKAKLSEIQKLETVDQCVERRRKECIQPVWQVVPYLCGSAPVCQERSRDALERAKVRTNIILVRVVRGIPYTFPLQLLGSRTSLIAKSRRIHPNFFRNFGFLGHEQTVLQWRALYFYSYLGQG